MATVYVLVCTTNPQILIVICCIHHPTHPMSRILFPILNFLDSDVCAVMTLIFLTNLKKCASFSKNVAILLLSFKQPIRSVAPSSVYKAYNTHNSSICSDEGLTLETSAFQSLYGGQFTLSTPLINQIFVVHFPTDAAPQFL